MLRFARQNGRIEHRAEAVFAAVDGRCIAWTLQRWSV